ncbi:MAG TPA: DISARM system helicase DrmA [Terriglobia bacterium]|nr:DISARM system helicase DrmA [Terriglobia bacterium]
MRSHPATATPLDVRGRLVEALQLDLVGPGPGHAFAEELIPGRVRPSTWYLTGFLMPAATPAEQSGDADSDEDLGEAAEDGGLAEENTEEQRPAKKSYFPSSMGLSFLVPASMRRLSVVVDWGDYTRDEVPGDDGKPGPIWRRHPRQQQIDVDLKGDGEVYAPLPVQHSGGLELQIVERLVSADDLKEHLPAGTRSVSVFLVNRRPPIAEAPDEAFVFQPRLEVRGDQPFLPRPDLRGVDPEDWDEQVADIHYADVPEYASGHGVSADWETVDGACRVLRTAWLPAAEVEKTETFDPEGVELSMTALGALPDANAVHAALDLLVAAYRTWIHEQREKAQTELSGNRLETALVLLQHATLGADRMERGIAALASDPNALDAFRVANRAVAAALRQRLKIEAPRWKTFQLAFLLLNLPGLADANDPHRNTVDLLFFPTGGGKTEAYLGLAAFAMVLRRLRHKDSDTGLGGAGVSVIMRYTLRLLTLDQLGRAAGLVCALELEREKAVARYGAWPFEIGLWVGKAATPNVMGHKGFKGSGDARTKVRDYQRDPQGKPLPVPIEKCPWCEHRFHRDSFALLPPGDYPLELRIVCQNLDCDFTGKRPLPIVAVDDPIYRRLPAFLIATVDKFASLPWVGRSGALLGGADRHDKTGFYGPAEPGGGKPRLKTPLPPPDLVIQDELHLISGPLGTIAGLYETAIEALCVRQVEGKSIRPKIVASTATVRRAQDQIQALFARPLTQVFPPPGPDRRNSFFARTVASAEKPARLYVGVAAQGRNPKVVLSRTWLALMGAAEKAYRDAGGERNPNNPADPYMSVLGYFNSLRELGGCRRILEEQIQDIIKRYGERKRLNETPGLFHNRKSFTEVVELTSRIPTEKIAEAKQRLERPFHDKDRRVDCAIATNMISVGLDIQRLGLMVVMGQPKTSSEYIQATSRVGRDDQRPGLVVTLLDIHKPRDRSHYERFRHYHETFYRSVEVGSVTPFSARALDRAFAGAMVTLARHIEPSLTPPEGAERIGGVRPALERRLLDAVLDRVRQQPLMEDDEREERLRSVQNRIVDLLDSWRKIFEDYHTQNVALQYQSYELDTPKPLLRDMLDKDFESSDHRQFRSNRSLRDVELDVNLFLKDLSGADVEDGA